MTKAFGSSYLKVFKPSAVWLTTTCGFFNPITQPLKRLVANQPTNKSFYFGMVLVDRSKTNELPKLD